MSTDYDIETAEYQPEEGEAPVSNGHNRGPRRAKPTMHLDAIVGPMLAAEIAQHADQVQADAQSEGGDPRIVASRVAMIRAFAAQISEYHGGER